MIRIVQYSTVLETAQSQGMRCLYYNSGAFGFAATEQTFSLGWIGPEDPTIRETARPLVRSVAEPFAAHLAKAAVRAWSDLLAGTIWVMPKSHWSYELNFGSTTWMPDQLAKVGIDPAELKNLTNAAAIEGDMGDRAAMLGWIEALLANLNGSDFSMYFPGRRTIATIHHHKQIWWTTADPAVARGLDQIVSPA